MRRAVLQHIAAAFVQAQSQNQFVGRHRLCRVLPRLDPLLHKRSPLPLLCPQLVLKFRSLCQNLVVGLLVLRLWKAHHGRPDRSVAVERLLVNVVEKRAQRVKVPLRCRIVFVIVANRATYGQAHECRSISLGPLSRHIHAQLFGDGPALIATHSQPYVPTGNQRIEVSHR